MRILVTGPGHSCTNLVFEIVRASGKFDIYPILPIRYRDTVIAEDRFLFLRHRWLDFFGRKGELPLNYAAKLATENKGFTVQNVVRLMESYDMYFLFCMRHPYDLFLSKCIRGLPASLGGDTYYEEYSPTESSPQIVVDTIEHAHLVYSGIRKERKLVVKLEDLIFDIGKAVTEICAFVDVSPNDAMFDPFSMVRNAWLRKRYGGKVKETQVGIYRNLDKCHDGYYAGRIDETRRCFDALRPVARAWGYEEEHC